MNFRAFDQQGRPWLFDVSGAFTSSRPGLKRTDTLWKALGKADVLHAARPDLRLVLLTTNTPPPGSAGDAALKAVCGHDNKPIYEVIRMLSKEGMARLQAMAKGDE